MILPPLLRPSYWFTLTPPPFAPMIDRGLLVLFSTMVLAGILVRMIAMRAGLEKMTKRLIVRASHALLILGVFGLTLYLINYERVPALSMRFGYLIWLAVAVILGRRIYLFAWKEIPAMRERNEAREDFNKWLPKGRQ